jgi:HD superfamily phosphohydrolase
MPEKIIRDPVHDIIAFRLEIPGDALLFRLINAREFQRLHRVRQLGLASLAYPGADHSRYSHSLGVMEIARRMLQRLRLDRAIDDADFTAAAAGALLHDLGHGPLSHVFERICETDHETQTAWLITHPQSDVRRILVEHDPALPEKIAGFLAGRSPLKFISEILSSQLDADRFDYLLRDNLMTGSQYGGFDLRWLLHALTIDAASSRLAITAKGISAVEDYLQSRYQMYRNVYFHKVVRTAEGMIKLALRRARRLAEQDRLPGLSRGDAIFKSLIGGQLTLEEFTDLDDIALLHCVKLWTSADDPILARLCRDLLYRRLYKTIDVSSHEDPAWLTEAQNRAASAVTSAGGDPDYHLFYDEPRDTPYEIYDGHNPASDIPIVNQTGKVTWFAQHSPLVSALSRQLMFRRFHVAPEYRGAVWKGRC